MADLFNINVKKIKDEYSAKDIEVLEGLEPVRQRPGMYIGGTDDNAKHHLVSEVLDNSMDEAVAGFASKITITLKAGGLCEIADNGRGIPIDKHPKFADKSALEVILTTLHSGGKFKNEAYQTAGGLHGVGISVVNALSSYLKAEIYRNGLLYSQEYSQGVAQSALKSEAISSKRKTGTKISFIPDASIFGNNHPFSPKKVYEMAKTKAYLHKGVVIEWSCAPELIKSEEVPAEDVIEFPGGIIDFLSSKVSPDQIIGGKIFSGTARAEEDNLRVEWALCWQEKNSSFVQSYCNTIPTPLGGTHEQGCKIALGKAIKLYANKSKHKKAQQIIIDDILENICLVISVFVSNPIFQGQTKEKLVSKNLAKHVESLLKDHVDHWLSDNRDVADSLVEQFVANAEYRINKKAERAVNRKTATHRLRLPGKLADCLQNTKEESEIFIVEGDSAGGSAKQARDRNFQAILPLRGKILNVANSTNQKILQNQQIQDLQTALGCGVRDNFKIENLRYDRVIIMSDADVDGAHIASLLMTFFYTHMPQLITDGHLYLARPPLYRIIQNHKTYYAGNNIQKEEIIATLKAKSKANIEIGRFKGLGEMTAAQLKETTMQRKTRRLFRITLDDVKNSAIVVDDLMGKKPEKRFQFIQTRTINNKIITHNIYM